MCGLFKCITWLMVCTATCSGKEMWHFAFIYVVFGLFTYVTWLIERTCIYSGKNVWHDSFICAICVLQCVAVCCSVLQCVAVPCSMFQWAIHLYVRYVSDLICESFTRVKWLMVCTTTCSCKDAWHYSFIFVVCGSFTYITWLMVCTSICSGAGNIDVEVLLSSCPGAVAEDCCFEAQICIGRWWFMCSSCIFVYYCVYLDSEICVHMHTYTYCGRGLLLGGANLHWKMIFHLFIMYICTLLCVFR